MGFREAIKRRHDLELQISEGEDELAQLSSHRDALARNIKDLVLDSSALDNVTGEQAQIQALQKEYADDTARGLAIKQSLPVLLREHEYLCGQENRVIEGCINQSDPCPGCGRPPRELQWTFIKLFATRMFGCRAVCPDCGDDVEFFEVD